jgi:nucleoside-diphosphate-sugar epimerase
MASNPEMFRVNALGTMNVFRAAADLGIERVVCASSINALGYNFGIKFLPEQLQYFPLDEAHPTFTTDPYSFSKHVIEDIGAYFWRRESITSVFLRFPAVYDLSIPGPSILRDFVDDCYAQTSTILAMPEPARTARVQGIIDDFERRAAAHEWETQFDLSFPDGAVMFGRSNFWTSLDVRDAAQAIEKSLLADIEGSHAIYVTDTHNFVGLPTRKLAAVFFPDVTTWKHPVEGTETLVSIGRAKSLIGFEPHYPYPQDTNV